MSKVGRLLVLFSMLKVSERVNSSTNQSTSKRRKNVETYAEWKRKKYKSCIRCGHFCNGKYTKPNNYACSLYQKRLK